MTTATVRANRVSVQANDQGGYTAKFHRTHKLLTSVSSQDTTYVSTVGMNKTADREMFRIWICDHASEYGIQWDPTDRRTDTNTLPAKYTSEALLGESAKLLITPDIESWVSKINETLPDGTEVILAKVEAEDITAVQEYKGRAVSPRYNNGNWAYATVRVSATLELDGNEGYVVMDCSLVSGQLKKPSHIGDLGYTYTGFRTEAGKDLPTLVAKPESKPESTTTTTPPVVTQEQAPVEDEVESTSTEVEPTGDTPNEATDTPTDTPATYKGRKLGSK